MCASVGRRFGWRTPGNAQKYAPRWLERASDVDTAPKPISATGLGIIPAGARLSAPRGHDQLDTSDSFVENPSDISA
jgi:hypothetical protein